MNNNILDEVLNLLNEATDKSKLQKCIEEIHKFCDNINKKYNLKDYQQMKKCNSISKSESTKDNIAYKVFYLDIDNFPDGDLYANKVAYQIDDGIDKICKKYKIEYDINEDKNMHPSLTGYLFTKI